MAGKVWKVSTRRGMAYVEGWERAERVLSAAGRESGPPRRGAGAEALMVGAMAVYLDPRGRPFAWQIPFDLTCWKSVCDAAHAGEEAAGTMPP